MPYHQAVTETYTTPDGRISVPLLGERWQIESEHGSSKTEVRCRLAVPGLMAFFQAGDSYLSDTQPHDPQVWVQLFKGQYEQKYEGVTYQYSENLDLNGTTWVESSIELLLHARLAPVTKVERVACINHHLLVVSVEAPAKDLRKYWPDASRWFVEVQFAALTRPIN